MAGPCPGGFPTGDMHDAARCRDRDRCQGPGCRVRRPQRVDPLLAELEANAAAAAAAKAAGVPAGV